MKTIFTFILAILIATTIQGQIKTHPNNSGVIMSDEPPEKWRVLSDENREIEAASELIYLVLSDSTRNKHADYWHIGQLYAATNQYEKAKFYMKRAVIEPMDDEQWMLYFNGTIAFLERDKVSLEKFAKLLNANHTEYYSANARTLNGLMENFEKTYSEAIKSSRN